uniref:Protein-lysine N-methyltransferase SMYD4 n=1 Tax=Monopterus albus TaxID=43700 RepID=A0A3Q3ICX1_MONAL
MDLPCVQWQDHVTQKWAGLDLELKERFTSLLDIDDVFKCALTLTTQDDLDVLQSVSAGYLVQKDTEQAVKCRERGNSSFKTKDYTAAALHYSQGVCFAPQSSEQLSLCYANRSAALYHLQHYQSWIFGYPSHLLHKLEERRIQCCNHLSASQKGKEDHNPALKNHKGQEKVKAPSDGPFTFGIGPKAAVGFSPEKGRHLVAAERLAAGEVILNDRPYSCVLIPGMEDLKGKGAELDTERGVFGTEHRRCHRCLAETLHPVPCDGCSYSRYCSTGCQREAWEEHHHWECPLGADLIVLGVMSHLALRVTLKAGLKNIQMARKPISNQHRKSKPGHFNRESSDSSSCQINQSDPSTSYYGDSYSSVFHLLHHLNHHSPGLRFLCAVTIATLYLKLRKIGPPPASWALSRLTGVNSQSTEEEGSWGSELWLLGSAVLRHFLQLRCNAQAILTLQDTEKEKGAANSPVQSSREICIATAIFPTLSLLNHSCYPNTSLVFNTGTGTHLSGSYWAPDVTESRAERRSTARRVTITVRASKNITVGQEIVHCYGPHSSRMASQERQRLLQEQYYFLCQCEACTLAQEEAEGTEGQLQHTEDRGTGFLCSQSSCGHRMSSSEVSHRLQEVRVKLEKAVDLMETEGLSNALRLLKRVYSQSGLILAETHPLQGELADAIARAYATRGDWNNAASHLERSVIAIGSQYGEDSIELGQQLFKLAQLHFNGGARGPALSVIPKVRRLLCLHRGPCCHELQELQAMENCLKKITI